MRMRMAPSRLISVVLLITLALLQFYNEINSLEWVTGERRRGALVNTVVASEKQTNSSALVQGNGSLQQSHMIRNGTNDRLMRSGDLYETESRTHQDLPLCTRTQVRNGRWHAATYPRPPYISKTVHLNCQPPEYYNDHPYETFDWIPEDAATGLCRFATWNATDFCALVRRTVVSIIGDSLSWEQYSSLLQLLRQRVHQTDQHRSKSHNQNHVKYACYDENGRDAGVRIVFRNDPRLRNVTDSINNDFPLILILNRGAHYVNDAQLQQEMIQLIEELHAWNTTCHRHGLVCHLFWRTTVPGHPQCDPALELAPVNDLHAMEARVQNLSLYNTNDARLSFHWYDFQRQNQLVLRLLEESGLRYTALDAYHINTLRPDGHRSRQDCLHNCYPGKMDVLNQLLLHFLRRERTPEHWGCPGTVVLQNR